LNLNASLCHLQTKYFDLSFINLVWLEIAFHFILKGVLKTQLLPVIREQNPLLKPRCFFPFTLWLENSRSKTTQKRSVLARELKIEVPEKLFFSF